MRGQYDNTTVMIWHFLSHWEDGRTVLLIYRSRCYLSRTTTIAYLIFLTPNSPMAMFFLVFCSRSAGCMDDPSRMITSGAAPRPQWVPHMFT